MAGVCATIVVGGGSNAADLGVLRVEVKAVCVAVCSLKGGTGKTTLAFNLAERAQAYGLRPLLVDCDVQEASVGFHQMGGEEREWPVQRGAVSQGGLERILGAARGGGHDFVICDLPGQDTSFLNRFLSEMDVVLSPVGPGPADLMSACGLLFSMQNTSVNLVFVPNAVGPGRARLVELQDTLSDRGGRVSPVVVKRLVVHMDALRSGLGVCEYAPESGAAADVDSLWQWMVLEVADRREGRNGSAG